MRKSIVMNVVSTKIRLFSQKIHSSSLTLHLVPQFTLVIVVGLILGLVMLVFPPTAVVGALAILISIYLVLKRPELSLVGILVLTSSILFEDQMPRVSFGVSLHLSDILLTGMLGLILVRSVVEKDFRFVRTPLDTPLWLFIVITILSTLIAVFNSEVEAELARRSIRVFSYYLTFFVLTQLVREPRQLKLLLSGVFTIAMVVALAMVAQFILGDSVQILPGRVEALVTQDTSFDDITRILPPGWSTVMISFMVIICLLAIEKSPLRASLNLIILLVFGLAIILTFLRSFWGALIAVIAFLFLLLNWNERVRFIIAASSLASLGAIILLVVFIDPESRAARLVFASTDRLMTLGESETFQGSDSSLNWRLIENEYAYVAIAEHPLIGLGMGTPYRPLDFRLDYRNADGTITNGSSFIHNGHLRIMLQSGLLGYLSLVWLSGLFLVRGIGFWRALPHEYMKAVVLGNLLVYLAILIAAVANSTFTQWRWTPLLGMMFGVNEVIYRFYLPGNGQIAINQAD